jgi:hypothetical protein
VLTKNYWPFDFQEDGSNNPEFGHEVSKKNYYWIPQLLNHDFLYGYGIGFWQQCLFMLLIENNRDG